MANVEEDAAEEDDDGLGALVAGADTRSERWRPFSYTGSRRADST